MTAVCIDNSAQNLSFTEAAYKAALWAYAIFYRDSTDSEFIMREAALLLEKLKGEGRLSELQKILGWTVNRRQHTIQLSLDKAKKIHKLI